MKSRLIPYIVLPFACSQILVAQDYSAEATYGDIELDSGFLPDPHEVSLSAGGSIDAADLGNNCYGNIADAPDLQLDYTNGDYPLIFSVGSDEDTSLAINMPDGNWMCDDDSGEGLNPLVEIYDPASGVYDIWVGAVDTDEFPPAILYISEEMGYYDSSGQGSAVSSVSSADMGEGAISGSLDSSDMILSSGSYSDVYRFDASNGQEIIIDLRSNSFDTMLEVQTPSGEVFSNDDYEGDTNRSLIAAELEESGEYQVRVLSYYEQETGPYTLAMSVVSGGNQINQQLSGDLSRGDATRNNGQYLDSFEFEGSPGRGVVVDLESYDFDTFLVLESPNGITLENDDTDHVGHSVIETELSEFGTYTVYVSSYEADETGDYSLSISGGELVNNTAEGGQDTITLQLGTETRGNLSSQDVIGERDSFNDYYSFTGSAGQNVEFEVNSSDFDTYLTVIQPDGSVLDNDDHNGETSVSQIAMQLSQSGRYSVIVSSYREGETGNYSLSLNSGRSSTSENFVADGGSNIYGIFVGISDYSLIGASDLDFTAEDAVVARDTLIENAGMNSSNAITLLDQDATVANVQQAFSSMANQVGPDDVFVFFFSGHGSQIERSGGPVANDADGLDETLVFADDQLTDDYVDSMFDLINADTSLIILDSCFSGGFSKDVISSPGRMGLFSSEEDVTSLVASKFLAGGYLSHFFHDAIEGGNADMDGDEAISALELSQYLYERYNAEAGSKAASYYSADDFGYQHLIADRGGVTHDKVIFTVR